MSYHVSCSWRELAGNVSSLMNEIPASMNDMFGNVSFFMNEVSSYSSSSPALPSLHAPSALILKKPGGGGDQWRKGWVFQRRNQSKSVEVEKGVKRVDVDLSNQVVQVHGASPVMTIAEALEQTGKKARLIGQGVLEGAFWASAMDASLALTLAVLSGAAIAHHYYDQKQQATADIGGGDSGETISTTTHIIHN